MADQQAQAQQKRRRQPDRNKRPEFTVRSVARRDGGIVVRFTSPIHASRFTEDGAPPYFVFVQVPNQESPLDMIMTIPDAAARAAIEPFAPGGPYRMKVDLNDGGQVGAIHIFELPTTGAAYVVPAEPDVVDSQPMVLDESELAFYVLVHAGTQVDRAEAVLGRKLNENDRAIASGIIIAATRDGKKPMSAERFREIRKAEEEIMAGERRPLSGAAGEEA